MLMAYLRKQMSRNFFSVLVGEKKREELAWFGYPQSNVECVGLA
jgi:hypothetical protein